MPSHDATVSSLITGMAPGVVTTGTLGWLCFSSDFESMGAREAAEAKVSGSPKSKARNAKRDQEQRDGTASFVPGTAHDEIWRDA